MFAYIPGCISDFLKTFFIPPFSVFYFIILVHFFIIYPVENISIKAYGIQADNLIGVDLPSSTDTRDELKEKLTSIYNIYARQNEAGVIQ